MRGCLRVLARICVIECVRACVRMCVCVCVRACVYVRARKAFRVTVHITNNGHLQGYLLEFHNLSRLMPRSRVVG